MAINAIHNYTTTNPATSTSSTAKSDSTAANSSANSTAAETADTASGVVYEKSSSDTVSTTNTNNKTQNSALVAKLKADSDNRISQLRSIVEQMMTKQGAAIGKADSMWQFLAGGNFTVDAATKAQAQADIAEDGYWGVEQTSDRILDFAKALSGDDPSKADKLLDAFKKGFSQATKSWGKTLPDISQKTYDAVVEKFDKWKSSAADQTKQTEA